MATEGDRSIGMSYSVASLSGLSVIELRLRRVMVPPLMSVSPWMASEPSYLAKAFTRAHVQR